MKTNLYHNAIFDCLEYVMMHDTSGQELIKQELVGIVADALNQKSVTAAHTVVDMLVALQYITETLDGNMKKYSITGYGRRIHHALDLYLQGKSDDIFDAGKQQ